MTLRLLQGGGAGSGQPRALVVRHNPNPHLAKPQPDATLWPIALCVWTPSPSSDYPQLQPAAPPRALRLVPPPREDAT